MGDYLDDDLLFVGNNAFDNLSDDSDDESMDLTQNCTQNMSLDEQSFGLFDNADVSEDALIAMGIDVQEIRAQKQIEQRLKLEKEQLEYAKQVQAELDQEFGMATSSSNNSQPPFSNTQHPSNPMSSSFTFQPIAPAPAPGHQYPIANTSDQPQLPAATASAMTTNGASSPASAVASNGLKRQMPWDSPRSRFKARTDIKDESDANLIDLSSFPPAPPRPQAESSTAAASSSSASTLHHDFTYIDSDDDLVDLTDLQDNAIEVMELSSDDDEDEHMMDATYDMDALLQHVRLVQQRRDAERRYGIRMGNPYPNIISASAAANGKAPRNLPFQPTRSDIQSLASMGHGGRWTTAKQQDELRKFLATIDMDEAPPPEARVGTPDDLIVHLMEHQKIGLQWMSKQENSINKGGLLADDMGLGKTIQALALIVSRRCSDAVDLDTLQALDAITQGKLNVDERVKIKTTLVVCPIGLMEQWATEIRQKTRNLSVYVYHGSSRKREVSYLAQFDIVISSYSIISMESSPDSEAVSPFAKCIFHRIVLDEAHSIKNRQTKAARACFHLEADYRWCLTATPLQNAVTDFFSLIHFLRIRPYNDWSNFRMEVGNVIRKDTSVAMKKLQIIVKGICLRRSKKATIDGQPIINLPERTVHFTHVDFTDDERQFYDILDKNVQQRFNKYLEAGTVMRNYSNVLLLLLRLRQACLHPSLTTIERPDEAATAANAEKLATTVDARVLDRLKAAKEELASVECPICMDTADKPQVIFHCGHILCRECLCSYVNTSTDYDNNNKTCPQCRGQLDTARIIPLQAFLKVHLPDLCEPEPEDTDEEILARAQTYLSSTKIDTMLEILEETREETNGEDKTIIFSQFTSMLDLIQSGLDSKGIKYGRYDGTMSLQNRNRVIRDFYADADMTVLLVSTKCGSLGLNLTMANRVILMDIWWNPALENQAIDRVHRIGQTKDVVVHRIFVNNTVEDRILELQKRKQGIADGALGEGTTKIARLGLQEMMFLFRGNPLPPSDPNSTGASS